ncbi:hypothetical protein PAXINDRAFT_158345 [Paxillus involutus ATCC 200175]|uniref:Uncharacterized protein n=1 Tax=Paxillus involutus ATCC 200175 TaxID=664439 RepID=A0A0C9SXI9_PAXIN|nr:hypothetical protein PAXINDRAFT_158345 [Paxillus involutus ATCC 200175]
MIVIDGQIQIFIDHCACFGCSSSSGIFDRPGNAIIPIFKHKGVEDVIHWADDYIFLRYPSFPSLTGPWSYSYDESLPFSIAQELGWPWASNEHSPFAFTFTYLGFTWDLTNKTVSIPLTKRQKYLDRMKDWTVSTSVSLKECQSVIGCLQHCTLVLSIGRSHLPSLYRLSSSFKDPSKSFIRHRIPSPALADITWWRETLSADWVWLLGPISTPSDPLPNSIFVDASTSFGIGLLLDGRWLAWRLLDGWNTDGCDISWAEMVAIDLGLRTLIHSGFKDCHLLFHSDNKGVNG